LYIFGINENLNLGGNLLSICGAALIFLTIKDYLKKGCRKPCISDLYLLFPYLIYVVFIPNNYFFKSQDEFVWWGASIKWIFDNNHLITAEFPEGHRHYPPGQQLFQYYFLKITFWSEANVLRAQNIFILSAILYTASEMSKRAFLVPITFLIATCAVYAFQFGYTTIMNDALLGATFAAAVASSVKFEKNWTSFLKLFSTTLILILLKDIGIVLAIIPILISSYKFFLLERRRLYAEKNILRTVFFLSILIAGAIMLRASWQSYVSSINSIISLKRLELQAILEGNWPRNFELITREFMRRFGSGIFLDLKILKLSMLFTTAIFTVYSLLLIFKMPRHKHFESIPIFIIYLVGLAIFIFLHLYLYIVWFGDYEGTRLASFERYMGIYYLSWLILMVPLSIQQFMQINNTWTLRRVKSVLIPILIISCIGGSVALHAKHILAPSNQIEMRREIEDSTEVIKKYISTGQKVYFIQQNSLGYEQSLFAYLMRPFNARNWCWSIGKKYYPDDVWTCDKELKDLINDYDYLYVYRADQQFWNNSKGLFDPEDIGKKSGIYKILKNNNTITLINVTKL